MREVRSRIIMSLIVITIMFMIHGPGSVLGDRIPPVLNVNDEGDGFVLINWTLDGSASFENLTGFRIYRTDPEGNRTTLDLVGSLEVSYNDTTAVNGITYDYQVSALYTEFMIERYSDPVKGRPGTVPGSPIGVSVVHQGNGITISWDHSDDNGGFPIERTIVQRSSDNVSYEMVGTVNSNLVSFIDSSADPVNGYSYRLIAINERGPSPPSLPVTIEPSIVPPGRPVDPVVSIGEDYILLEWDVPESGAGSPVAGFTVKRSGEDGSIPVERTVGPNVLFLNDTSVSKDVNYTYTIHAFNDAGNSEPSRWITAVIYSSIPDLPEKDEDQGKGNTLALIAGLIGGMIVIAIAIFIYLRLTDDIDEEEEEMYPLNGPPVNL